METYRFTRDQLWDCLLGAIGMYREYLDVHEHREDESRIDAANEVMEGLDAERELCAAGEGRLAMQLLELPQAEAAQAQHCPYDLIDIVESTWGDNATALAYLVDEAEGEATLPLRGVGDWQMYERDADGYWEKSGEGTGVKHTAIRLTKAGAEQLDRWHTDDMLPDDDGVQP